MRKARSCLAALGFLLAACGGNDFEAAEPGDGGPFSSDESHPGLDGYTPPPDHGVTVGDAPVGEETEAPPVDAGGELHGDDGVTDANGERVVADATSVDTSVNDATPDDAASDAAADAPPDVNPDRFWVTDVALDVPSDGPSTADGALDAVSDVAADAPIAVTCDAPTPFYRDRDRDGFGSTDNSVLACAAPADDDGGAWVAQPGDCRDDLYEVKPFNASWPDPPSYSGTGYLDPVRPRGISFDYDCNGNETPDPTNQFGGAPTCPALATGCNGTGYMPASPARSGVGVGPLCGSTTLKTCVVQGLGCKEQYIMMATPFRCR